MQIFFYFCLFIFGTLFGSFGSVLIYRLKSGEAGILTGRSHCPKCGKTLKIIDLFPIFSWLSTFGKCRYCKTKISLIYPFLELSTGLVFLLTGIYLVDFSLVLSGDFSEIIKFIFYIIINFITILYIFYDILFLEIHEGIMFFGISLAFIYFATKSFDTSVTAGLISTILGVICLGGFYTIMIKGLKEIYDILIIIILGILLYFTPSICQNIFGIEDIQNISIYSSILGAFYIFLFFYLQIFLSRGRALGGGDLRIGIMMGLILQTNFSLNGIISSYLVGSLIGIFIIIKNFKKKGPNIVPFGPFLGMGFFLTIFYGEAIEKYIENYLLIM